MFGEKHSLKNMQTFFPIGHKAVTFDKASGFYRRTGKTSKVACDLWYFMNVSVVEKFQIKIPGLIVK